MYACMYVSGSYRLPVDPARTLLRRDVHLVQVDVHLGDVDLEAVSQEPDRLPC